jgi:flagellar motor switch protein FliG
MIDSHKKLNGVQKAAIFLMVMGEEFTTAFFKKADPKTVRDIGLHMSEIAYVPPDVLSSVMDEFERKFVSGAALSLTGKSFLKQVADKSPGESAIRDLFKSIERGGDKIPFIELATLPAQSAINMFKGEHPQTVALILSNLPQEKAAEILSLFPDDLKADIAYRIMQIGDVQNDVIEDLDEMIRKEITGMGTDSIIKFDGIEALAGILNEVDRNTEACIISHIEKEDGDMAEKIRQKMFVFEDLLRVDDKSFREILKNIGNEVLVRALKTASEELKQKIFKNLSERAAEMLRDDLDVLGPVRLKEVEDNQQQIIRAAKKLEAEGRIVLSGKGKDDVFV